MKINVKIFCGRDDVPAYAKLYKQSIEEAARNCRYAFFDRISKNNKITLKYVYIKGKALIFIK